MNNPGDKYMLAATQLESSTTLWFCDSMKCNGKSTSVAPSERIVMAKKGRLFHLEHETSHQSVTKQSLIECTPKWLLLKKLKSLPVYQLHFLKMMTIKTLTFYQSFRMFSAWYLYQGKAKIGIFGNATLQIRTLNIRILSERKLTIVIKELESGKDIYAYFRVSDEMTGAIAFWYTEEQDTIQNLMRCGCHFRIQGDFKMCF